MADNIIKAGTIVYVKTTDEPVFCLEVTKRPTAMPEYPELSGVFARVRRPIAGENGIAHLIEFFTVEELETAEAGQNRKLSEMEELRAKFQAGKGNEQLAAANKLPLAN